MRRPRSSLPAGFIKPMEPTLVDSAPDGDNWLHEIKYDGYRTQIVVADGAARAFTRRGHDWTERYAPVAEAAARLPCESAILDGEMIVQDAEGRSDYHGLLKAMHREPHRLVFYAFDLLGQNGQDLRGRPLVERREMLQTLVPLDPTNPVQHTTHFIGNGPALFQAADKNGLEGIVSKLADSRYSSGPTRAWLKAKCFSVDTFEIVGVKIASDGKPYAIMATPEGEDAGEALVNLPRAQRDAFWRAVDMLETPRARLAPFLKRRHKAKWLKAGLSARVKHMRGEVQLRHATVVSVEGRG